MRTELYEHRSGLKVVPTEIVQSIVDIIEPMTPVLEMNSITIIKKDIKHELEIQGWSREFFVDTSSKISITAFYSGIGLCLQTGNAARIYADLLKLQTLYIREKIRAGIIIVPVQETAKLLGKGMATFERINKELPIFNQVITMPIVVIGFDGTGVQ